MEHEYRLSLLEANWIDFNMLVHEKASLATTLVNQYYGLFQSFWIIQNKV